jgi:hypothetical protein
LTARAKTIGHVSLLDEIPKEEETPEQKEKRELSEKDKIAQQMAYCLTSVLDKIKPICEMITRVSVSHKHCQDLSDT